MTTSQPLFTLRKGEVFEALETSPQGLTAEEAEARRGLYGRNVLAAPAAPPAWRSLLLYATHPMALLLWAAGLAALLIGRSGLGLVIWAVVLVNAGFSFWRERRAGQAVAALSRLLPSYARVVRDGHELRLPAAELVPGDVLALAEGDSIPADARLVESYGLRTNNSTLTGESLPALKISDASLRDDLSEIERPNLVFAGTSVVAGTGRAVIYATGMVSQFGRIANLTQALKEGPSLMQAQMARITRAVSLVALALGALVFVVGIADVGIPPQEAFLLAIGILVAAIPEGLVPTVTLTLAMAVQRLARQGFLIKKLSAVETLGAVSVICTDKSGTLTQNQMTVRKLWLGGARLNLSGVGYEPKGKFNHAPFHPADLQALATAALLCNNARLVPPAAGERRWSALGDQTEAALKVLALRAGLEEQALEQTYPRIHELPFDARRKRMSTLHRSADGTLAFVKGAPGEVLALCSHIQRGGHVCALDETTRAEILRTNDDFARQALRVLALARRELPAGRSGTYTPEGVETGLTFLGLAGMMDPPRPEIAQAVQAFHAAGIRLVMITGDYGLTAESLARRVGMLRSLAPRILTGAELDALDDAALGALLGQEVIYARMAPEHKLRLVSAFQAAGEVVAVIGDGVNDTPALRKADVGIAMGDTGTDVAREAADAVVVGDDFALIVRAIEEGRAVYDNLRKFMTYIFASNVPEILPFILTALFNIPLALTVAQILAIDLGTDLLPALALGMEAPEPDVMQRPPRRRSQPVVDRALLLRSLAWLGGIETVLCYTLFFLPLSAQGYTIILNGPAHGAPYLLGVTVFHAGVVMAQVGNAFACRTEKGHVHRLGWLSNPTLLLGIGAAGVVITATIYLPALAQVFDHRPLPPELWLGLVLFAPIVYGLEWVRKYTVRRGRQPNQTVAPAES